MVPSLFELPKFYCNSIALFQLREEENGGEGQIPDKVLNTMMKHGGTQKPFSYVPTGMDLKKFKEKARQ